MEIIKIDMMELLTYCNTRGVLSAGDLIYINSLTPTYYKSIEPDVIDKNFVYTFHYWNYNFPFLVISIDRYHTGMTLTYLKITPLFNPAEYSLKRVERLTYYLSPRDIIYKVKY